MLRRKTIIVLTITFMVTLMVSAFSYLYISQVLRLRKRAVVKCTIFNAVCTISPGAEATAPIIACQSRPIVT